MSRFGKFALGYGVAGLIVVTVGAFMIHTGFGILMIGALAVISARQVLEQEQVKAMQAELKEQMGGLGDILGGGDDCCG